MLSYGESFLRPHTQHSLSFNLRKLTNDAQKYKFGNFLHFLVSNVYNLSAHNIIIFIKMIENTYEACI